MTSTPAARVASLDHSGLRPRQAFQFHASKRIVGQLRSRSVPESYTFADRMFRTAGVQRTDRHELPPEHVVIAFR